MYPPEELCIPILYHGSCIDEARSPKQGRSFFSFLQSTVVAREYCGAGLPAYATEEWDPSPMDNITIPRDPEVGEDPKDQRVL